MTKTLKLGSAMTVTGRKSLGDFELPAHHLLTHGLIVGMTYLETLCITSSSMLNH